MGVITGVVKHSIYRFLSVLCVGLVLAGIGYAVYVAFIQPHGENRVKTKTMNQQAETIKNEDTKIEHHYGIFHFKLGPIQFGI